MFIKCVYCKLTSSKKKKLEYTCYPTRSHLFPSGGVRLWQNSGNAPKGSNSRLCLRDKRKTAKDRGKDRKRLRERQARERES